MIKLDEFKRLHEFEPKYPFKEELAKHYGAYVNKDKMLGEVSLDDYPEHVVLCCGACFGRKTRGLTAEQMYRKWGTAGIAACWRYGTENS